MVRALAAIVTASLLLVGSVAVSGVSATAALADPYRQQTSTVETRQSAESAETRAVSVERTELVSEHRWSRTESRWASQGARDWNRRLDRRWEHRHAQDTDADIHLGADFFIGAGGVGAEPADGGGGGGGAMASAGASGSASASAFASAHAHGGGRGGGHGGGHGGHHSSGGCGCKK